MVEPSIVIRVPMYKAKWKGLVDLDGQTSAKCIKDSGNMKSRTDSVSLNTQTMSNIVVSTRLERSTDTENIVIRTKRPILAAGSMGKDMG